MLKKYTTKRHLPVNEFAWVFPNFELVKVICTILKAITIFHFQAQLDEFEIMRDEYKEKREDSISIHDEEPISDDEN